MSLPTKRTSKDPLVRALLDSHKFNLLSVPRKNAAVYDVYVGKGRNILPPSRLADLFNKPPALPDPQVEKPFKAPDKTFSSLLEVNVVARLVGKLFAANNASLAEGTMSAEIQSKGGHTGRIKFRDVIRDYVGPIAVHRDLSNAPLPAGAIDFLNGRQIYLTVGVVRAKGLEIEVVDEGRNVVKGDIDVSKFAEAAKVSASVGVTASRSQSGTLLFDGPGYIAVGVELVELTVDPSGTLRVGDMPPALDIMDAIEVPYAFIGAPDGPIFADLPAAEETSAAKPAFAAQAAQARPAKRKTRKKPVARSKAKAARKRQAARPKKRSTRRPPARAAKRRRRS
jgi:hypothetical protein